ncbi:hypothetical protein pb186bvf_015445 [Paramecium bursaria]
MLQKSTQFQILFEQQQIYNQQQIKKIYYEVLFLIRNQIFGFLLINFIKYISYKIKDFFQYVNSIKNQFIALFYYRCYLSQSGIADINLSIMRRQVVLLGQIGSGKTSMFNKICNTNLKTQAGGDSCTRQVFLRPSAYGKGFKALDTPGFGSDKQMLPHAAAIIAALQEGPVDRIIIVVKFDRIPLMKKSIQDSILPIKRYLNIITILVTHWDLSTNQADEQQIKKDVCGYFSINSYILSGINTRPKDICEQIEATFGNQSIIKINNSEIQGCFDLLEECQKNFEIVQEIDDCQTEFKKLCSMVEKFIFDYDRKSSDLDEVMHAIIQWLKKAAEDRILAFEMKQGQRLNQIYSQINDEFLAYLFHVELKKALTTDLQRTIQIASDAMRLKPDHPFNKIKQCPNCGLIWLKVLGCDGVTTCGNFPSTEYGATFSQLLNYQISYGQNGLQIVKKPPYQQIKINYDINNQKRATSIVQGCGAQLNWGALPPLTEGQMKVLNDPGLLDFLTDKREQTKCSRSANNKIDQEILNAKKNFNYQ